ncbi:MAG: hypothetical protein WC644_01160 [Ignavibacteria bacterium]
MYSPKINPELISPLYHAAKSRGIPMTKLVNQIIYEHLESLPVPEPEPQEKVIPMGFNPNDAVAKEAV